MGNRNSGRWGPRDGRPTTDTAARVTIGALLCWRGDLGLQMLDAQTWIIRPRGGHEYAVRIAYVTHFPTGTRRFFQCPECDARAAVMYARFGRLACRGCMMLCYQSQMESRAYRRLRSQVTLGK